jgi:tetratricopeptide (TPR) repeat protein
LIQRIAQNLESYVRQLMEKEDLLQLRILTSHCEMFLNHPQLLTKAIKDSLLSDLGGMYLSLGNYTKAKQVLNDALSKLNKAHHNNYKTQTSAKLAQTLAYLGTVYGDLGYYETAKDFLEQSLLIYEKNLSTNYEGAAWALTYLGNVYRDLGEPQKAKELLERSLHLYKTYLHENHAGNAVRLHIWALCTSFWEITRKPKTYLSKVFIFIRPTFLKIMWVWLGFQLI